VVDLAEPWMIVVGKQEYTRGLMVPVILCADTFEGQRNGWVRFVVRCGQSRR
jgi:hypothetical protein